MNVDLPWKIKDNNIHSKSMEAWSRRQEASAQALSRSTVRRTHSDMLFEAYVANQIEETLEYNAIMDVVTSYELDLLA